jgi:hypothetical protein
LQVEAMKAQWIKKERELEQEKENVRKQAALFKQVLMHTALKLLPLFSLSLAPLLSTPIASVSFSSQLTWKISM